MFSKFKKSSTKQAQSSIALPIVSLTCLMFLVTTCIIAYMSYANYKKAFYEYSTELCLSSNAQASHIVDGDLVERYVQTLTVDEQYIAFAQKLDELKSKTNIKYFYILADTGIPNKYTYIYSATYKEENPNADYVLGLTDDKADFEGAQEVLATGKAFDEARYYNNQNYGELYYAYAPILNSEGKVVAFIGTDIDVSPLNTQINTYWQEVLFTTILAFIFFSIFTFMATRYFLIKPMQSIAASAEQLAQGNVALDLPEKFAQRTDEIGLLGRAFADVAQSVEKLIFDIDYMMQAIRNGDLNNRASLTFYQGDYRRIMTGINGTLDMVCQHFDAIPEAIAFVSSGKKLLYANKGMHKFCQRHDINPNSSQFFEQLTSFQENQDALNNIQKIFTGQNPQPFFMDLTLPAAANEDSHSYSMTLLPRTDSASKAVNTSIMMIISDVTVLIKTINDLELASNTKSDFLSRMSHEIRTPLNAIIGMSRIGSDTNDIEKIKSCLFQVENSSHHLLGIINDILDISKIEAGKMLLVEQEFSLTNSIDTVLSMLSAWSNGKNVVTKVNIEHIEHDWVTTDMLRLNQVLLNLLSNAVKFSFAGGNVELTVNELSHSKGISVFLFSVRDYGIGINPEQAQKLFKPFEQGDANISHNYGGTGLGLVIAKSIVELMGGSIKLESELGKGSTFTFTIRTEAKIKTNENFAIQKESDNLFSKDFTDKRMLLVDDIEINREIVIEILSNTGIKIDVAEDGQEAFEKFSYAPEHYYDIILMDMQMPVLDGCEATKMIRALDREDAAKTKIIAMTANVMRDDIEKALKSGMDGHIGKPIDFPNLLETMDKVFRQK